MKYSTNCGTALADNSKFCQNCGAPVAIAPGAAPSSSAGPQPGHNPHSGFKAPKINAAGVFDKFNDYIGNDGDRNLNWRMLFTDVRKKHTRADAEKVFMCGTSTTTPPLSEISTAWPHPWLYSRVFLALAVGYVLMWIMFFVFHNSLSIPGLIILGSFAIPLTVLVLFLEVNVFKNISVMDAVVCFLIGGCASLVITQPMFALLGNGDTEFIQALIVGIVEETAKAVIAYVFIKRLKVKYILPAMLVGAAVGAGFAAFESAGYALVKNQGSLDLTMAIIYLRAFLAPGGHVIWAAMSAAGLVMAYKVVGEYKLDLLVNAKFLRIFIIPVVLHTLWDSGIFEGVWFLVVLTIVGWAICLLLVNMGLAQAEKISQENRQSLGQNC